MSRGKILKHLNEIDEFNVLITGVGGQGNILASRIMADAAMKSGLNVRVGETFGASQRGGPVVSHVRMGTNVYSPLVYPHEGDGIIGLEPIETLRTAITYASKDSLIIFNNKAVFPVIVKTGKANYPELSDIIHVLERIARNVICLAAYDLAVKAGNPVVMNIVMLGAFAGSQKGPIPIEAYKLAIKENVPKKWIEANLKAFDLGILAFNQSSAR